MVDSPRWNPVLAKQLAKLGGVKYIFLTHKWVGWWHRAPAGRLVLRAGEGVRAQHQSCYAVRSCMTAAVGDALQG
jgi:hypothetical protein